MFMLASVSLTAPIRAEDGATGLFDTISRLIGRPEDKRVTVPKRRKSARPTPVAPAGDEAVQPTPAAAHAEGVESREPVQPSPVAAERPPVPLPWNVAGDPDGVPPSRVLRAVEELVAEIEGVRRAMRVGDLPPEAKLIEGRTPIHVFAKSLEIMSKVVDVQRRLNVPEGTIDPIPSRSVGAVDVLSSIEKILSEVRKIRWQFGIDRPIARAPLVGAGAIAMIYKRLADASFMLDGLRGGPLTSNDVHAMALSVLDEMMLVADHLGISLNLEPVSVTGTRYPLDVAVEVARAAYKVGRLQAQLQMDASWVPNPDLARVTPSTNYDATNMLLAEMARIKLHLGIDGARAERTEQPTGRKPKHNAALFMLIVRSLDRIVPAVSG